MIDIYLITNNVNGKQYVGKTQVGYMIRFKQHLNAYDNGERHYLACAIHKYGKDNFNIKCIAKVDDDSWEFWEQYYINILHTHYTEGGYNITKGGDYNPMNDPTVIAKHHKICISEYYRNLQRALSSGRKHSEATKQLCRNNTLANLDICLKGFRAYNESRKTKVGMIVNNKIVKVFNSLAEAARYVSDNNPKYKYNVGNTSQIKHYADKFNKNGTRSKFLGYSWTLDV